MNKLYHCDPIAATFNGAEFANNVGMRREGYAKNRSQTPHKATNTPRKARGLIFSPSHRATGRTNKGLVAVNDWAMPVSVYFRAVCWSQMAKNVPANAVIATTMNSRGDRIGLSACIPSR